MSLSRLQLRRLTTLMLVGWLLALGVSVAHACGLIAAEADHGHAAVILASDATPDADDHAPGSANPSCVKFCDDGKSSASSAGTIAVAAPAHVGRVAPLLIRPDVAFLPLLAAWRREQGQRPPRELPIELLRLTL